MSIDSNSNNSKSDHRNYFQRSCSTIYVAFSKGSLPLMGACFRPRSKLNDSDLSSSLSASGIYAIHSFIHAFICIFIPDHFGIVMCICLSGV